MADLGSEREVLLLGDDDAGGFNVVVDEGGVVAGQVVHVIEAISEVGGDLRAGEPRGQNGEVGVVRVAEAVGKVGAGDVFVDEVDVVTGEGGTEELDEAGVVGFGDLGEVVVEVGVGEGEGEAVLALENDDVLAAKGAAEGGGGGATHRPS
ncbi:unnamed protein product [Prunus armeniaca]|uniref:Uncharacterized protein n=1 Tax=Prunus armeniaca TaxID=36596 RepID=A0A6J5WNR8_PRUAR|nr:unnamed protein product [Prunus armeniaca]CAB4300914.1 unnamed protein product [Prunus armeniaca]